MGILYKTAIICLHFDCLVKQTHTYWWLPSPLLLREKNGQTFGAHKAPADIDMTVVAVALLGGEVVGADEACVGDHLATCRHTLVTNMVRHWAS